jgi:hypothetical protein
MGASVYAYWPGITEEQIGAQPGFANDDRNWGNWMAEREDEPDVLRVIADLGAAPLLTVMTDGWDDDDVTWVTPQELRDAADRLRRAVEDRAQGVGRVIAVYARNANPDEPVIDQLLTDLADIATLARWAETQGASKMTLYVGW